MTHPGGALGRRLLTRVRDAMRSEQLPFVAADAPVKDAIIVMTEGRLGMTLVGSADDLHGVLTDGDLRRLLLRGVDLATTRVGDVASATPRASRSPIARRICARPTKSWIAALMT